SGLDGPIKLHGSGWSIFVEKTGDFSEERDAAALETFFEEVMKLEGTEKIIGNESFNNMGYPHYEESPYVLGQYIIIPDIDNYLVVDQESKEKQRQKKSPSHSHGYLPDHPRMYPALLLSGNGIRKG